LVSHFALRIYGKVFHGDRHDKEIKKIKKIHIYWLCLDTTSGQNHCSTWEKSSNEFCIFDTSISHFVTSYSGYLSIGSNNVSQCACSSMHAEKTDKKCHCLLCFPRFRNCPGFLFHLSFPAGRFFSSISRTFRFLQKDSKLIRLIS